MRILYVSTDFNRSGAALAMIELADNIRKHNHEVILLFPGYGDAVEEAKKRDLNYSVIRSYEWVKPINRKEYVREKLKWFLKHIYNIVAIKRISNYIAENKIDIVHINTLWGYVGAVAAKNMKIPYVWHMREMLELQGIKIRWKRYGISLVNKAEALIAISAVVKENYANQFDSAKIKLIYDGVDAEKFLNKRKQLFQNRVPELIVAGGVRSHKRQRDVIGAVKELRDNNLIVHLSIVGDDKTAYAESLKKYVDENKLQDVVTFVGETSEIQKYWKKADIGITASEHEAFGRVTVESMLSGCLTVTSDSGAGREIIENDATGYIYKLGDVDELALILEMVINDKKRAMDVARNGQNDALSKYDSTRNAEQVLSLYKRIIGY